jgi:hypothetical protein
MEIAFWHLLSNAIRFSQKRIETVIEVEYLVKNDQLVYFVKDNGTSFNSELPISSCPFPAFGRK